MFSLLIALLFYGLPSLPAAIAVLVVVVARWLVTIEVTALSLIIALVVALVITLVISSVAVVVFVKNNESGNHSRHPSAAGEDERDEKRSTTLVNHGKWREDYSQYNSEARHFFKC